MTRLTLQSSGKALKRGGGSPHTLLESGFGGRLGLLWGLGKETPCMRAQASARGGSPFVCFMTSSHAGPRLQNRSRHTSYTCTTVPHVPLDSNDPHHCIWKDSNCSPASHWKQLRHCEPTVMDTETDQLKIPRGVLDYTVRQLCHVTMLTIHPQNKAGDRPAPHALQESLLNGLRGHSILNFACSQQVRKSGSRILSNQRP